MHPHLIRDQRFAALLHHRDAVLAPGDSLVPPLCSSSVFHLSSATDTSFTYARTGTPAWQDVEAQLSLLEDAEVVLFPSGMSAIASVFYTLLQSGSRVLLPSDGYYMTRSLAEHGLTGFDVELQICATRKLAEANLTGVDLLLVESPSNPGLDVIDIAALAARARASDTLLVVDNTTATAAIQQPLDLGADLVVCSDTKAAGGHSDLLLGHVSSRNSARLEKIRAWRSASGAIPGAFESWLLHRGLETLDVRLERMCSSALTLARELENTEAVQQVRYPGLTADPAYPLACRQMQGFGSLIGMTLSDRRCAERFIRNCPLVSSATSFGSVHSSADRRARWGDAVPEGFVRLSVGCEPTAILCDAIVSTLKTCRP